MQTGAEVLVYMAGFALLLLLLRIFRKPLYLMLRLLVSSALGGLALVLVNTFGGGFGLSLGINPVTALVAGFLGLPGIGVLLLLKLWL